ncbi:MAG: imidazole glycerol phosphate synthase subunit HisH [Alphaproteobacteria bacterium]|nr:imidazole glycerol phosphate synthase subunit HisH [Alphaproteobacteria bacterium]
MSDQKQSVVIIDYGSGNIRSAAKAFEHVITEHNLDFNVVVSGKAEEVGRASHIVLPGQGAFGDCMQGLQATGGMIAALEKAVLEDKKPFLGICVGMQLLATRGLEFGEHQGLGWIEGEVIPIKPNDKALKIPHMGWNVTDYPQGTNHPVLKNQEKNRSHFYFVHSFMFKCKEKDNVFGQTHYGGDVTAIVGKANMIGVQFHPEKSQEAGLTLLKDFLLWNPSKNC